MLRESFERDETLQLIKKIGDNMPTFLALLDTMEAVKGMIEDFTPSIGKISKEIMPTINMIRESFERDETLKLVKKVGDNIPTFLTVLDTMEAVKGMIEDFSPSIGKISKEIMPTINMIRESFERDETLKLINRVGQNIPTFLSLLDVLEAAKGMAEDFAPSIGKISKEIMPTINMIRESLEKEEVLELIQRTGENIGTLNKLMGFLNRFDKSGILDFTLENVLAKETGFMIKGLQDGVAKTMRHVVEKPIEPGFKNIFSAMRDPEVQKGILMMTMLARNMSLSMTEAIRESHETVMNPMTQ
ncbi:MAG: DUF1641 domain-containing protein, partial [Nitrospirota bacterium]